MTTFSTLNILKKYSTFIVLLFFIAINFSCKSSKDIAQEDTREHDFNFNKNLYEATKQKYLENYDKALQNYNFALRVEPNNPAVHFEIAGVAAILEDYKTAIEYSEKSVDLNSSNIFYVIRLAKLYQLNGDYQESTKTFYKALKLDEKNLEIYGEIVSNCIISKEFDKAIKALNLAEETFGVNENITFQKIQIHKKLNETDKAIEELKSLIKYFPDNSNYTALLLELYLDNDKLAEAKKLIETIENQEIYDHLVYITLADFYIYTRNYNNMFNSLEKAFKSNQIDVDNKVEMFMKLLQTPYIQQTYNDRMNSLSKILVETHPNNPKALTIYGDYLVFDEKFIEAREVFKTVLEYDNTKYIIWEQLLYINGRLNDFDEMLIYSNKAIELFPLQAGLYYFNAISSYYKEEYQTTIKACNNGIYYAIDKIELKANLLGYLGDAYNKLEKYNLSDSVYEEVLKITPNNIYIINNYAYYLSLRKENLNRALELGEKLYTLSPNNVNHLDTYAWILFSSKKFEKALRIMEKAISKDKDISPTLLEHYGDILYVNNNKENAIVQWKKAKELGAKSEILDNKILNKGFDVED